MSTRKPDRWERLVEKKLSPDGYRSRFNFTPREVVTLLRAEYRWMVKAVENEEELAGPMPQSLWDKLRKDKHGMERALRAVVRVTKKSILAKLKARAK